MSNMDDTLLEFSPVTDNNETTTDINELLNEENNIVEKQETFISDISNDIQSDIFANINNASNSKIIENNTSSEEEVSLSDLINENKPITNEPEMPINEIVNSEPEKEEKIDDILLESVDSNVAFSNEYNKLNEKEKILNMNPELQVKVKKENKVKKYAVLLPIFAFVSTLFLGVYLFVNNTNADTTNLIRIEKNKKVGYINSNGDIIVTPKYVSGTDYYRGYAIVQNQNSLSAVIDNKGSFISPFGNYFYIERFSNRYVGSKFTNKGLKLALLNSSLEPLTRFKYDNITYGKDNTFIFVREDTMGILNDEGKEIYTYESNEIDDKNISIEVSKVISEKEKSKYAKIKLNDSATIVNIKTGKEVYKYTLDDISVLDNNVFYISSKYDDVNNRYIIVKDDQVIYQTYNYKRVRIDDYDSNIAIGVKNDVTYDYIDLNKKKIINDNNAYSYTYGDGVILKKTHNIESNEDVYEIMENSKTLSTVKDIKPVTGEFKNGFLKVFVSDDKYNYIDKKGKLLNEESYTSATNFNKFGYAIVSKDNSYGIIDKNGDTIVSTKYSKLDFLNDDLFKMMKEKYNKVLFIYSSNSQVGIISKNDEIIIKAIYDDFDYITNKYPMIIGKYDIEDILINLDSNKEYSIEIYQKPVVLDGYFVVGSKYYNYDGKKIYDLSGEN